MFKYNGYTGRLLFIDLTRGKFREESLEATWAERFVGGRGLGARILFHVVKQDTDPLSPENKLIFVTGPLTGTRAPGSSRFAVLTKSPLTGIYLESICGGNLGSELKFAGYDAVIFEGRAEKPIYVSIVDREVKFKDAAHLWGLTTSQTQRTVKDELGGIGEVACIGPAGERLVGISSIHNEKASAARGGVGAVMGSKNLKAIAAVGNGDVLVHDIEALESVLNDSFNALKESYRWTWRTYGTMGGVDLNNVYGTVPTKNFQQGVFESADDFSGVNLRKKFMIKNVACGTCTLACKHITYVKEGAYKGAIAEGPEYETVWAFGPLCGNDCFEAIIRANMLCDDLGLDTMSTGNVIGFAMECYEKRLLDKKQTGGIELRFGNHKAIIELIEQIAYGKDFGNLLAEGVEALSKHVGKGSERFAMHVKGLGLGGYDPRGSKSMGLVYAIGNRGGCHHSAGRPYHIEMVSGNGRFEEKGKGILVKASSEIRIIYDSLMLCTFLRNSFGWEFPVKMLNAVTGMNWNITDLKRAGDRINCVERAFNVREGVTRKDDVLPERLLKEPLPNGPSKGHVVNLNPMLDGYYEAMGWNKDGVPTRRTLESLKCTEIADDLENL